MSSTLRLKTPLADKTRSFHDQIEIKQKELQPWTIQINQKQAKIDLAKSERETLARKFEAVREAKEEAENNKNRLQGEKEVKVSVVSFLQCEGTKTHRGIGSGAARSAPTQSWNGRRTRQIETASPSTFSGYSRRVYCISDLIASTPRRSSRSADRRHPPAGRK